MANADVVAFNIAAFITALFLLEFGADKFIDHTVIVARRINVSQAIIGLLTAGAEWEELVVVIASLSRARSSLAVGNVIGSTISNILGAFSLGLLTHKQGIEFDRSSRIYSILLLLVTTFVAPLAYFPRKRIWVTCGSILLASFVVYVASVAWAISRGNVTAPEGSDSDSSEDDSGNTDSSHDELLPSTHAASQGSYGALPALQAHGNAELSSEQQPLITPTPMSTPPRRKRYNLRYHIGILLLGFLSICLAGYVLSHAAATITDEVGISDVLFGVIILALATTLPEKLIAVLSGYRGHAGVLIANTVGSNIFLLTLCMGIVMVETEGNFDKGSIKITELCVMWGSTLAFTITVWFGGRWSRWIGGVMLACYLAFIILEFTVIRKV